MVRIKSIKGKTYWEKWSKNRGADEVWTKKKDIPKKFKGIVYKTKVKRTVFSKCPETLYAYFKPKRRRKK